MADSGFQHPGMDFGVNTAQALLSGRARMRGGNPVVNPEYQPGQDMARSFLERNLLGVERGKLSAQFATQNNFVVDSAIQALRAQGFSKEATQLQRAVRGNAAADIIGQMMNVSPVMQGAFGGNVIGANMNALNAAGSFGGGFGLAGNYGDVAMRQMTGLHNAQRMTEVIAATALRRPGGQLRGVPDSAMTGGYSVEQAMNAMTQLQVMGANTGMGMLHRMSNPAQHVANATSYAMGLLRDVGPYVGGDTPEEHIAGVRAHAGSGKLFRAAWNPTAGVGDILRREMLALGGMGTAIGRGAQAMQPAFEAGRRATELAYMDPVTGVSGMAGSDYSRAMGMRSARNVAKQVAYRSRVTGVPVDDEQFQDLQVSEARRQFAQENQSGTRNVTVAGMLMMANPALQEQFAGALGAAVRSGNPSRVRDIVGQVSQSYYGDRGVIGRIARSPEAYSNFQSRTSDWIRSHDGGEERLQRGLGSIAELNEQGAYTEMEYRRRNLETRTTMGVQRRAMADAGLRYDPDKAAAGQLQTLKDVTVEGTEDKLLLTPEEQEQLGRVFSAAGKGQKGIRAVQDFASKAMPDKADAIKEALAQGASAEITKQYEAGTVDGAGSKSWNRKVMAALKASDPATYANLKGKKLTPQELTRELEGVVKDEGRGGLLSYQRKGLTADLEKTRKDQKEQGTKTSPVSMDIITRSLGSPEFQRSVRGAAMESPVIDEAFESIASAGAQERISSAARGNLLQRAASAVLNSGTTGDARDESITASTKQANRLRGGIGAEISEADVKAKVKEIKDQEAKDKKEADKAPVVKLAAGTELILVDGDSRHRGIVRSR